jgi:hypothetical protein
MPHSEAVQELIQQAKFASRVLHNDGKQQYDCVADRLDATVAAVEAEEKPSFGAWISTKSGKVPDREDRYGSSAEVLVFSAKHPEQILGRYRHYNKTWTFSGSNSDFTDEVTHWMPLPAKPSGLLRSDAPIHQIGGKS